ncbi:ArdC-like ssDNA-binding domain-containing protein [Consotaella aegiceratis]|uniref:ArdC-like ssDNA-binding domain-containing protein n=1 Tax=Consotaella aegiceratis TaxID=3097961 RepID=UPI002F3FA6EC
MAKRQRTSEAHHTDVYERATNKIVEQLEQGVRPWFQPWSVAGSTLRPLRANGVPYRGINTVLLWMEAQEKGFASPYWMTYRQAQAMGAQVRKGEHSSLVVYANTIKKTETTDEGEEVEQTIPFMKGYSVFNAAQIDGLPEHYRSKVKSPADAPKKERIERAEA